MLFEIHKVYTIYDYGPEGQMILEIEKDEPEQVDITAGRRNELLGVVEGSKADYTEQPIKLIDSNSSFRFSKKISRPTAFFLYLQRGYILNQITVRPDYVDQDILLESFTHDSRLIYCLFADGQTQVTIRGSKTKDDSMRKKLLKSPKDIRLRRVLLEQCKMDYKTESLKDKEILDLEEAARFLTMEKGTLQNKASKGTLPKPISIDGTKVYLKSDLLKYVNSLD